MVVELAALGWSVETTTDLPLPEFNQLYECVVAARLRWRIQEAFTMHVATQGTTKELKQHLKPLIDAVLKEDKGKPRKSESKEFLKSFPKGL